MKTLLGIQAPPYPASESGAPPSRFLPPGLCQLSPCLCPKASISSVLWSHLGPSSDLAGDTSLRSGQKRKTTNCCFLPAATTLPPPRTAGACLLLCAASSCSEPCWPTRSPPESVPAMRYFLPQSPVGQDCVEGGTALGLGSRASPSTTAAQGAGFRPRASCPPRLDQRGGFKKRKACECQCPEVRLRSQPSSELSASVSGKFSQEVSKGKSFSYQVNQAMGPLARAAIASHLGGSSLLTLTAAL